MSDSLSTPHPRLPGAGGDAAKVAPDVGERHPGAEDTTMVPYVTRSGGASWHTTGTKAMALDVDWAGGP